MIDVPGIVRAVEAALPEAAPFAVAPMLTAQLAHVDASTGLALLDQVVTRVPASAWGFTDAALDRCPEPVRQHALACIRALPPGKDRIEALRAVARRLTLAEDTCPGLQECGNPEVRYRPGGPALGGAAAMAGPARGAPRRGRCICAARASRRTSGARRSCSFEVVS